MWLTCWELNKTKKKEATFKKPQTIFLKEAKPHTNTQRLNKHTFLPQNWRTWTTKQNPRQTGLKKHSSRHFSFFFCLQTCLFTHQDEREPQIWAVSSARCNGNHHCTWLYIPYTAVFNVTAWGEHEHRIILPSGYRSSSHTHRWAGSLCVGSGKLF